VLHITLLDQKPVLFAWKPFSSSSGIEAKSFMWAWNGHHSNTKIYV